MKLKINQKHLSRIMQIVSGIADRKSTMTVAKNVLIDVQKTMTTFRCTDLVNSISARISIESDDEWATTVDAKLLTDIAKVMPKNSDVEIKNIENKNTLVLKSGKSKFDLLTLPAIDFPIGKDLSFDTITGCSAIEFSNLISKTSFSIGTDSTRPHICSMLLEFKGDKIKSVATDGHKMAIAESKMENEAEQDKSIVVPFKCINEVKKMTSDSKGVVEICCCDNEILFEISEQLNEDGDEMFFELQSKLVEYDFPPYEKVMPKKSDMIVEFKRDDMINAARRLRIMNPDKNSSVKLILKDSEITLETNGATLGNASESIEAVYSGGLFEIGLNVEYLIDACSVATDETLTLGFTESLAPSVLKDDSDYTCVIMPIRLS